MNKDLLQTKLQQFLQNAHVSMPQIGKNILYQLILRHAYQNPIK